MCGCKELIKKVCDKGFIRTLSNCECEYHKSCDVGEYLDYKNCWCRRKLFDNLVEECNENIYEKELHPNKMIGNSILNDYKKICSSSECSSCIISIVFFGIFSIKSVCISSIFYLFSLVHKKKIYSNNNLLNAIPLNI